MDDDDETEVCSVSGLSRPWCWKGFGIWTLGFAAEVASSLADYLEGVTIALAAAYSHDTEQREFADAVRQDIESLKEE